MLAVLIGAVFNGVVLVNFHLFAGLIGIIVLFCSATHKLFELPLFTELVIVEHGQLVFAFFLSADLRFARHGKKVRP